MNCLTGANSNGRIGTLAAIDSSPKKESTSLADVPSQVIINKILYLLLGKIFCGLAKPVKNFTNYLNQIASGHCGLCKNQSFRFISF